MSEEWVPVAGCVALLESLELSLPEELVWSSRCFDDGAAMGVSLRGRLRESPIDQEDAVIIAVDGTIDPTEPNVATMEQPAVEAFDCDNQTELEKYCTSHNMTLVEWMGSHLNATASLKGLVTAYILSDSSEKITQHIQLRIQHLGRKLIVECAFDTSLADVLAVVVFRSVQNIYLLPSKH
jgi:hypothetical protein